RHRIQRQVRRNPGNELGAVPVLLSASPLVRRTVNPGLGLVKLKYVVEGTDLREHRTVERNAQYDLLAVLTVIVLVRLVLVPVALGGVTESCSPTRQVNDRGRVDQPRPLVAVLQIVLVHSVRRNQDKIGRASCRESARK